MPNLRSLLADLQQQLQQALTAPQHPMPSGVKLHADRVTLSLKLALEQSATSVGSSESGSYQLVPASDHGNDQNGTDRHTTEQTLTIEFRVDSTGAVTPMTPSSITTEPAHIPAPSPSPFPSLPAETVPAEVAGPNEGEALQILTMALGAPGFDSSARATVFCEAMDELNELQRIAIWESLGDPRPGIVIDPALRRARHLLRGILRSGPGGTKPSGPAPLAALFAKHPSNDLLNLIRTEWKTQADWL